MFSFQILKMYLYGISLFYCLQKMKGFRKQSVWIKKVCYTCILVQGRIICVPSVTEKATLKKNTYLNFT